MTRSSSLGFTNAGQGNPEILRHHLPMVQMQAFAGVAANQNTTSSTTSTPYEVAVPRRTLLLWNFAMFLFHSALATVTLVFGSQTLSVPLYKTVIDFVTLSEEASGTMSGEAGSGDAWRLIPSLVEEGSLPFTNLVASFFILSAAFHLLNCTLWKEFYLKELSQCRTPTRWLEYFFSAPVMILLIAYTLGVRDRSLLFAIAVLIGVTMPFGYWTEQCARPVDDDTWKGSFSARIFPWVIGHVPQLAAWVFILLAFYDGTADTNDVIPWFVHLILWAELVLFFSFGFASLLSQWYPPKYFYRGELVFQVLSLVSKGLLGLLMITNVLMLSRFEELYD